MNLLLRLEWTQGAPQLNVTTTTTTHHTRYWWPRRFGRLLCTKRDPLIWTKDECKRLHKEEFHPAETLTGLGSKGNRNDVVCLRWKFLDSSTPSFSFTLHKSTAFSTVPLSGNLLSRKCSVWTGVTKTTNRTKYEFFYKRIFLYLCKSTQTQIFKLPLLNLNFTEKTGTRHNHYGLWLLEWCKCEHLPYRHEFNPRTLR